MTRDELDLFVSRFDEFAKWPTTKQIDYLTYYLTTQPEVESVTAGGIEECFRLLDLRPYSRMSVYFSENTGKKDGKYIKHSKGYRLERSIFEVILYDIAIPLCFYY